MTTSYTPCFDHARAFQWETEWETKHARRWRSLSSRFGGSHLYAPVDPVSPITLETNESRVTILALERELNDGKQLSAVPGKDPT